MAQEFVIQPNRSLGRRGRTYLLYGMSLIMVAVTLRFLLLGGWMVAPFMLAEFLLLVYVFCMVDKKCCIVERVIIEGELLTVYHEEEQHPQQWSFPLHWVSVDLKPGQHPSHGSRLLIGSHGNWVELAGFLTNIERESLTSAIKRAVNQARH